MMSSVRLEAAMGAIVLILTLYLAPSVAMLFINSTKSILAEP